MYAKGKVALVTGAARQHGIGRAIALRLAQEGADVVVSGRHRSGEELPDWEKRHGWLGLESVRREIEALGRNALAVTADISSSKEVNEMVEAIIGRFGRIDILVNNASFLTPDEHVVPVVKLDEEIWEKTLAVNLTGAFLCCKAVAKEMVKRGQGGKIINIASINAKTGGAGFAAYSASKAGVLALTRTLALELAPYKINVNAVCPASVTSAPRRHAEIERKAGEWGVSIEEARERLFAEVASSLKVPLGRLTTPEDVAHLVAFLASNYSDHMTGQAINVSGGRIMH